MCSRFSYCHGGGGYLSLYFPAERQEIKGRQSSLTYLRVLFLPCDSRGEVIRMHILSDIRNSAAFGTPQILLDYDGLFFGGDQKHDFLITSQIELEINAHS